MQQPEHCQCQCGAVRYTVKAPPLVHAYCHCTICQAFNEAPFGDILLYRAQDVDVPDETLIEYNTHRPPPAVQRGKCRACGKPAVEHMKMPGLPTMIFVPTKNVLEADSLPPASMHLFYHSRVADIDDPLPKHSGYWPSQWAFMKRMLVERLRR